MGNAIVVSSKSAKDVLKNTRCLHDIGGHDVYWLTKPEYFDLVPDLPCIRKKVDIASNEAVLLASYVMFNDIWVFDDDLRGRLLGRCLGFDLGNITRFFVDTQVRFHGYSIHADGNECIHLPIDPEGLTYIFNIKGKVDDYIFHLLHKPLGPGRTYGTVGIYFGGGDVYKKLPFPEYNRIVQGIIEQQIASSVVLFGPEGNEIRANTIMNENKNALIINTVGKIPKYNQLAHGFRECDVILSEDNFGMHLALAIGMKTVGLFGHTDPMDTENFYNLRKVQTKAEVPCYPCGDEPCRLDENCWNDFDIYEILATVREMNLRAA